VAFFAILLALGAAEPHQAQPVVPEKPKLICRQGEQELGTHIHPARTCKTADEWRLDEVRRNEKPATFRITPGQGDGVPRPEHPQL
jgi:hypothetical protein